MVAMTIASRPVIAATLVSLALTGLAGTAGATGATGPAPLTVAEATRLVDRVPTPALHWTTCRKTAQCATAELPLD
jgi:hypothetical protein